MAGKQNSSSARQSQLGLDGLSFFVADMQTGFGPFVAVYLATQSWTPGDIGLVLGIGALAAVVSEIPGGALVDTIPWKRILVALGLGAVAVSSLIFAFWPSFTMVMAAEILHGASSGIIKPSLAAFGLGIVGYQALSRRLGRNHRYNALGNGLTAVAMGALGYLVSARSVFFATAALCIPAFGALSMIRRKDVDYKRARGGGEANEPLKALSKRDLVKQKHLHVFVLCLLLFQISNASLIPLASARLGAAHQTHSVLITSAFVALPQVIGALLASWVAARADAWGRKPLLVIGYAAGASRCLLFTLVTEPWQLIVIQALDGISAAVIGVMTPLVVADLTRGTGRYNFAQGWAGTAVGIGGAVSTAGFGYVAQHFGYASTFLILAAIGVLGAAVLWILMPETGTRKGPAKERRTRQWLQAFFARWA